MNTYKIRIAIFIGILGNLSCSATGLNPDVPPSNNFDLTCWNLTLPIGPEGKPTIISTSTLSAGYQSKWFHTNSHDGGMLFWCPVNGSHTKGSKNPRSELRETFSNGALRNWSMNDGPAQLSGELAVNQVPSDGKVVIAQIHDVGDYGIKDEPLVKLTTAYSDDSRNGRVYAEVRKFPDKNEQTDYTIALNISLKEKFYYALKLADGILSVSVNGNTKTIPIDSSWQKQKLYFKAGDYPHDHEGPSSEGAKVVYYVLNPPEH